MEDETGIANVIITPDLYERQRLLVTRSKFLLVEGSLQNQDGVIHVKAVRLSVLFSSALKCAHMTSTNTASLIEHCPKDQPESFSMPSQSSGIVVPRSAMSFCVGT
jgi:DNA polymerase III alpha subunit